MKTISESIAYLSHKWQLSNVRPMSVDHLRNYVALVYSAYLECDVIFKILIDDTNEPEALKFLDGNGVVKLLAYDAQHKGLLLENITPGNTLNSLFPHDDARALEITAALIKKMHQHHVEIPSGVFKTVKQWLEPLYAFQSTKIPVPLLTKACRLSEELLSRPYTPTLLHADLHHENILQCADDPHDVESWIAIDPKGVIGPLEFEIIRFLMNPKPGLLQQPNVREITEQRIKHIQTLFGYEPQRLRDWMLVQAVLSCYWAEHDGADEAFDYFMKVAQIAGEELTA